MSMSTNICKHISFASDLRLQVPCWKWKLEIGWGNGRFHKVPRRPKFRHPKNTLPAWLAWILSCGHVAWWSNKKQQGRKRLFVLQCFACGIQENTGNSLATSCNYSHCKLMQTGIFLRRHVGNFKTNILHIWPERLMAAAGCCWSLMLLDLAHRDEAWRTVTYLDVLRSWP